MKNIKVLLCSIGLCLLLASLSSCEKDEIPVEQRATSGDIELIEVGMGADYRNQLFFDLESSAVVNQNLKTEWDLGFDCSENGWHIITNTAKAMFVGRAGSSDFNTEVDVNSLDWEWDHTSGGLDSTAIGNWIGEAEIFIIDRGFDWLGVHQGYVKFQMESLINGTYHFKFSELDGTGLIEVQLPKNNEISMQCFSFTSGGSVVDIQPDKNSWDLLFSQYLESLHDGDDLVYYLVTGVIMNKHYSQAILETELSFEEINLEYAQTISLSENANVIGYDWKYYDFQSGTFIVNAEKVYIIQDSEGLFFKLRFLDFYNSNGEKGFPNFELQRL